jgi:hypothetical protein
MNFARLVVFKGLTAFLLRALAACALSSHAARHSGDSRADEPTIATDHPDDLS